MSVFDIFRREMAEVVAWSEEPGVLAIRYESARNHLIDGSTLVVREGQIALLYENGGGVDVFQPGEHRLATSNVSFMTSLVRLPFGAKSPDLSELFFIVIRDQRSLTWGTAQRIKVRTATADAGNIRAFGRYSFRIVDPAAFLLTSGGASRVTLDTIEARLRAAISAAASSILSMKETDYEDVEHLCRALQAEAQPSFSEIGLSCLDVTIENLERF